MELRSEWLQPELERGGDPEIPARAAEAPEELRLLGLAGADDPSVGGDQLDRDQVVDREPVVPLEPTDSPAERQPGDAGVADDPDRADEAVRLRGDVELAEERATVRSGRSGRGVDLDSAHRAQVDHQAAIGAAQPGGAVPARPSRDLESKVASEPDRRRDLVRRRRTGDRRRPTIVDGVPETPGLVVGGVLGRDDLADCPAELVDVTWCELGGCVDHYSPPARSAPWARSRRRRWSDRTTAWGGGRRSRFCLEQRPGSGRSEVALAGHRIDDARSAG